MLTYSLKRTTDPASEPVTRTEAKLHLRIPSGDTTDDSVVDRLIAVARQMVERDTRRSLMPQTWTLKRDDFAEEIELPYGPVTAITSVSYIDGAGTSATVGSSNYTFDAYADPAVLRLTYSGDWPTHRGDIRGVTVVYATGYASADAVPAEFKQAIFLALSSLYDGEAVLGTVMPIRETYFRLVDAIRGGSYP